jgi:hypothetical protein
MTRSLLETAPEPRIVAWFAGTKQAAAHPDQLAEAVHHTITTGPPRLRYLDSADAEACAGRRARMPVRGPD